MSSGLAEFHVVQLGIPRWPSTGNCLPRRTRCICPAFPAHFSSMSRPPPLPRLPSRDPAVAPICRALAELGASARGSCAPLPSSRQTRRAISPAGRPGPLPSRVSTPARIPFATAPRARLSLPLRQRRAVSAGAHSRIFSAAAAGVRLRQRPRRCCWLKTPA